MSPRDDSEKNAALEKAALEALAGRSAIPGTDPAILAVRAGFDAVAEGLGLSAASPAPAGLRDRILSAVREMPERPATTLRPGVLLVRTTAAEWKTAFPGVHYKDIHRDAARRSRSILFRMEPGSTFPEHSHTYVEELYVLEGSAVVNGKLLRAGDYCRSDPGTSDKDIYSAEGTVYLAFLTDESGPENASR